MAWISCKTPGKSLIHLHHTYIYYHCFFINIIMIAGLPRVWGHRLRRDSFREYMAFYLQGIISISSSDPYQQKYHLQWNMIFCLQCDYYNQYSTATYYHIIIIFPCPASKLRQNRQNCVFARSSPSLSPWTGTKLVFSTSKGRGVRYGMFSECSLECSRECSQVSLVSPATLMALG